MPPQTAVNDITDTPYAPGIAPGGEASGIDRNRIAGGYGVKVVEFTIATAADSTVYAVTVPRNDGTTVEKSVNSGTGASKTSIRDLLIAASIGDPKVAARVLVVESGTDTFKLIGFEPGDDFPVSESDANITLATVQAATSGEDIPFGVGVMYHLTLKGGCRLPVVDGTFMGVARHTPSVESAIDGTTAHKAGTGLPVRYIGPVCVRIDDDYTPAIGDSVFLRYTADANGERGYFRGDADSGEALALSGCRWDANGAFTALGGVRVGVLFLGAE